MNLGSQIGRFDLIVTGENLHARSPERAYAAQTGVVPKKTKKPSKFGPGSGMTLGAIPRRALFKAHGLLYHSTLNLRVMKKKGEGSHEVELQKMGVIQKKSTEPSKSGTVAGMT